MMNALPSFTEALKGVQTWTLHYHRTGSIETTWNQLPVRIAATIQTGLENAVMEDVHIMRAASEMPWCLEHADEILKLLNTMAQSVHPSSITLIRAGSIWLDIMAPAMVIHQWNMNNLSSETQEQWLARIWRHKHLASFAYFENNAKNNAWLWDILSAEFLSNGHPTVHDEFSEHRWWSIEHAPGPYTIMLASNTPEKFHTSQGHHFIQNHAEWYEALQSLLHVHTSLSDRPIAWRQACEWSTYLSERPCSAWPIPPNTTTSL